MSDLTTHRIGLDSDVPSLGLRRRFRRARPQGAETSACRVGVVGLGYWGPNLLRVISDLESTELAYVCDQDRDRLDRMARRYPAARASTDLDDLLGDESLDAVILATPVGTHAGLADACLRAGKHTFVEKPLAASSDEAGSLARVATERGLVLMCGHTFTYSPPVRAVKQLIDRGDLGDLYFISSSRVNLGLHQRDVSVLWDLGPHDFSILRYWLGESPLTIAASGRDAVVQGIPDVAFLTLEYGSGVLGNIELSWLAPSKLRRTVLVGSEKMVVYEDGSPEPVRIFDHGVVYEDPETFGEYHLSYRTGDIVSPRVEGSEPLSLEIQDFIEAARAGRPLTAQLDLALDVVEMIEAAEESLNDHGGPVRLAPVGHRNLVA